MYNGLQYDSKKEAHRAAELDLLLKAGEIKWWMRQPKIKCEVNGKKVCTYIGDFQVKYKDGREEIEDVKGMRTPIFNLKKKLVEALYGIEIKII